MKGMKDTKQQGTIVVKNDIYDIYLKLKKAISWGDEVNASDNYVFEFWLFPALKEYLLQTEDSYASDRDVVLKLLKHFLKGEDIETLPDELIPFIPENEIQEIRDALKDYSMLSFERWQYERHYLGRDDCDYEEDTGKPIPEELTEEDETQIAHLKKVLSIWEEANKPIGYHQ